MKHMVWLIAVSCASCEASPVMGPSQTPASTMTAPVAPPAPTGQSAVTRAPSVSPGNAAPISAERAAAASGAPANMAPRAGQSAARASAGSGGAPAQAGTGGTRTAGGSGNTAGAAAGSGNAQTLPAITDYSAKGPFQTTVEPNSGPDGKYTLYRPEPLGTDGFQHSPIIFGPGIATSCAPNGSLNIYTDLLNHFASHGFVTICANSLTGGPNAPGNLSAMQAGLDWIIEQNTQSGPFQGKLAVDRAVTMGYSIGATASTQLSSHAAIMTTISIHGHNTMGDPHGPIWLVTGTMDVIDDNRETLTTLAEAPAVLSALPIGHLDVVSELGQSGRYIAPLTAWLRYWVNADQGAKHIILGADCETCTSPWIAPESNDLWKALPQ